MSHTIAAISTGLSVSGNDLICIVSSVMQTNLPTSMKNFKLITKYHVKL